MVWILIFKYNLAELQKKSADNQRHTNDLLSFLYFYLEINCLFLFFEWAIFHKSNDDAIGRTLQNGPQSRRIPCHYFFHRSVLQRSRYEGCDECGINSSPILYNFVIVFVDLWHHALSWWSSIFLFFKWGYFSSIF